MHYKCVADGDGGWGVWHLTFQARILFVAVYWLLSLYVVVFQLGLLYIILVPFFFVVVVFKEMSKNFLSNSENKKTTTQ